MKNLTVHYMTKVGKMTNPFFIKIFLNLHFPFTESAIVKFAFCWWTFALSSSFDLWRGESTLGTI